jgi:outer membrane protein assembly factor BamB
MVFSSPARSSIYGVSAPDGTILWDLDLQKPHRWIGASDGIAILLNPVGVYGVDITSGKRIWKVEKGLSNGSINDSRFVLTDIGLLFSSGRKGAVDLIDPATGEIQWSQQTSGWVRWIVDADDLVLIVSGYGWGNLPITLNVYEKVR